MGPITASVPGEKMVLAEGAEGNASTPSWAPPTGYTQEASDNDRTYISSGIADVTLPVNGSSGTPTATLNASGSSLTGVMVGLRPVTSTSTTYGYDTLGDRTSVNSGTTTTLGYDQLGHLVSYGSSATYSYNGDGLRMSKTLSSTTTQETWSSVGSQPELLADGSTYYVYGPDGLPLEQINGSTVLYYQHDQLRSTRVLTNGSGAVADTYTYDPTGNLVGSTGSDANPIGFVGSYTDHESGYLYLVHRYYDPSTGHFRWWIRQCRSRASRMAMQMKTRLTRVTRLGSVAEYSLSCAAPLPRHGTTPAARPSPPSISIGTESRKWRRSLDQDLRRLPASQRPTESARLPFPRSGG